MHTIVLTKPHEHAGALRQPGERLLVDAPTAKFIEANGIGQIVKPLAPEAPVADSAEPAAPESKTKKEK